MNAHNSQSWAGPEPGAKNSIQVTCVGGRDAVTWATPAMSQGLCWLHAAIWSWRQVLNQALCYGRLTSLLPSLLCYDNLIQVQRFVESLDYGGLIDDDGLTFYHSCLDYL